MKKIVTGTVNMTDIECTNMMIANAMDIKSCDGVIITVDKWVQMEETETGAKVLVMRADDGTYYATISAVFIEAFKTAAERMGEMSGHAIKVIKGTSKQGRNFFSLELVR